MTKQINKVELHTNELYLTQSSITLADMHKRRHFQETSPNLDNITTYSSCSKDKKNWGFIRSPLLKHKECFLPMNANNSRKGSWENINIIFVSDYYMCGFWFEGNGFYFWGRSGKGSALWTIPWQPVSTSHSLSYTICLHLSPIYHSLLWLSQLFQLKRSPSHMWLT